DDPDDRPAGLRGNPGGNTVADFALDRRIADHPALPDVLPPRLELRLDESQKFRPLRDKCKRSRQHGREADKARIAGHDVNRLGNVCPGNEASVQPFMDNDARVLAELPGELPVTD